MEDNHRRERWAWIAVLLLVGLGAALRMDVLEHGYTSDEIATLTRVDTAMGIFTDPETGVNPPLWRLMWNVPFDDLWAPQLGRWFSFACGLGAIALAFLVGRRSGAGSLLAGVFAAGLVAFHPMTVEMSGIFRVYSFWSLVMLWHLYALGRLLAAPRDVRRGWMVQTVLSGMLLPWIHYFSVPMLLIMGGAILVAMPGKRMLVFVYLPSAILASALLPWVLFEEGRRVAPGEAWLVTVSKVAGLGLTPPPVVLGPFSQVNRALGGSSSLWSSAMAFTVIVMVVASLLRWKRATPTLRVATVAAGGVLVTVLTVGQLQYVREPTITFMVVCAAPVIGAVVSWLPGHRWAMVGWVILGWWFGASMPEVHQRYAENRLERDAPPHFMHHYRQWNEQRGNRSVYVHPAYAVGTLYYYGRGEHFGRATLPVRCRGFEPCFVFQNTRFIGVDTVGSGNYIDGLLVSFEPRVSEAFASDCERVHHGRAYGVFVCR